MNTRNNTNSSTEDVGYFDLHVKGCGYLSRIREVPAGKSGRTRESFLACAINAMHGPCNDPSYSYFDLRATGAKAEALVRDLWKDVDEGRKVFVAFRAGDVYSDPYETQEKDPQTRQPTGKMILRSSIKGRLLQITHAKVDGEVVFDASSEEGNDNAQGLNDDGVGSAQADDNHPGAPVVRSEPFRSIARTAPAQAPNEQRQAPGLRRRMASFA